MKIQGTFEVQSAFEPPLVDEEGITIGRARFTKQFSGELAATSIVELTHASATAKQSGVYVAIERVVGTLSGKRGSFCLYHTGIRGPNGQSLAVHVVPDSGTGELAGLRGTLGIDIVEGKHHYWFDYDLDSTART